MVEVNKEMTTEARDGLVIVKSKVEDPDKDDWQDEMAIEPHRAIQFASLLIKAAGNCNE